MRGIEMRVAVRRMCVLCLRSHEETPGRRLDHCQTPGERYSQCPAFKGELV